MAHRRDNGVMRLLVGRPGASVARWSQVIAWCADHAIYLLLGVLLVAAALLVEGFLTAANLVNVINQSAVLALLAIGQTFVIAGGMIDLSVGQLMALVAVVGCDVMAGQSADLPLALVLALGIGIGVGLVNGLLVDRLGVHPLIVTFGMLSVLQGAIFLYTDRSVGLAAPELLWLANGTVLGIPASLLLVAATAVAAAWLLQRTRFGLHLRALGANVQNARRAGVRIGPTRAGAYVVSGLAAAAAGMVLAGRLGTGYPNAGAGFELDSIVAVVLGGTSLAGGHGTIAGTLVAVLVLGLASNILNLLEVAAFVQMVIKGLIVVAAVVLTQRRRPAWA